MKAIMKEFISWCFQDQHLGARGSGRNRSREKLTGDAGPTKVTPWELRGVPKRHSVAVYFPKMLAATSLILHALLTVQHYSHAKEESIFSFLRTG